MVRAVRLLALALAAAATVTLTACGRSGSAAARSDRTEVSVSVSACGQGWKSGAAGPQHFVVRNTDTRAGEVDLISSPGGAVYAEIEPLAPGTTTTLDAALGAGRYAFRCSMEDEPSIVGSTVTLSGPARGAAPAVQAVSQADLIPAVKAYESYVTGRLPALLGLATALSTELRAGDLAGARRDWLPAHLAYERLGAAYDAFGAADAAINGLAEGLPGGVHDPSWRGFHRIEYGLAHGQSAATLRPFGVDLVAAIRGLIHSFPTAQIDPLDIGIRAHEISENALEFSLSGRDDYGSHSGLATVRANLDGTREVLDIVHTLLTPRYPGLAAVTTQLDRSAADLDRLRARDGAWPALSALTRTQRELINSDISELSEVLAPVASILEPRRTS